MPELINKLRVLPAILALLLSTISLHAQKPNAAAESDEIGTVIEQQKFVFLASWIIDYQGNRRQLTPPYSLTVTSDSIECHLPYQGRIYSAPPLEDLWLMGIRFTSKKYRMVHSEKRSGWDINITPEDTRNVQELHFAVASKGWTTLFIRSADRDRVSYEGRIEPLTD